VETGIAAVTLHRRAGKAQTHWVQMLVLCAVSAGAMLPLSGFAWSRLPELRFVQFPWRWMFPLAVALAFFLAEMWAHSRRRLAVGILLAIVWAACGAGVMACAFWNSDEAPDTLAAIQSGQGYEGTDEYVTLGADHYDLPMKVPEVALVAPGDEYDPSLPVKMPDSSVTMKTWQPEHKVFTVDSPRPVRAALQLLNYPAWQVRENGRPVKAESDGNTGQMLLTLPNGRNEIDVQFGRTPDRTAGATISCLGIVMTAGMWAFGRRRTAPIAPSGDPPPRA
jgi:hypothetical protein